MRLHIEELTENGKFLAHGVVDKDICKKASYRLPRRKARKTSYLFYTCLPMPVTLCPAHDFQPSHLAYHCPLCASRSNKREYFGGILTHSQNNELPLFKKGKFKAMNFPFSEKGKFIAQKSYVISPSLLIT